MGVLKSIAIGGAKTALRSAASAGTNYAIDSALSGNLKMPDVKMPDIAGKLNIKIDKSNLSLPSGVENYLSPPIKDAISKVGLPSSINGVSLPSFPDLTSVIPKIESAISSIGLTPEALGISDITNLLKGNSITALMGGKMPSMSFDVPDVNSVINDVDISSFESSISSYESEGMSLEELERLSSAGMSLEEVSKYF